MGRMAACSIPRKLLIGSLVARGKSRILFRSRFPLHARDFHCTLEKSVPRSECSWFHFSFQDENLVFEDFARQNLKDSGDPEEGKKGGEAAVDE